MIYFCPYFKKYRNPHSVGKYGGMGNLNLFEPQYLNDNAERIHQD
jgi:hypothetical protein